MNPDANRGVVRVRPETETMTRQQLPCFVGISGQTVGAKGISPNLVGIPPGVPHPAVNCSASDRALAPVVRNVADEHESVVPYEQVTTLR